MTTAREFLTSPAVGITGQVYVPVNHLGMVPKGKCLHTWDCWHWDRKTTPGQDPPTEVEGPRPRAERVSYVALATIEEQQTMARCAHCSDAPSARNPATEVRACPKCFTVHPAGDCY